MPDDNTHMTIPELKTRLEERQYELLQLLAANAENSKPVELDQTRVGRVSRMDAMQVQAMEIEVKKRRQQELRRIEDALQRISNGDYGYCTHCDEPIDPKRLALDPSVALCIDCA